MEARYKVGDKVRVRIDLEVNKNHEGTYLNGRMIQKYGGQIVTICEVEKDDFEDNLVIYAIEEDDGEWTWIDLFFEPVINNANEAFEQFVKGTITESEYEKYVEERD